MNEKNQRDLKALFFEIKRRIYLLFVLVLLLFWLCEEYSEENCLLLEVEAILLFAAVSLC
jgi:hypothetical protein